MEVRGLVDLDVLAPVPMVRLASGGVMSWRIASKINSICSRDSYVSTLCGPFPDGENTAGSIFYCYEGTFKSEGAWIRSSLIAWKRVSAETNASASIRSAIAAIKESFVNNP